MKNHPQGRESGATHSDETKPRAARRAFVLGSLGGLGAGALALSPLQRAMAAGADLSGITLTIGSTSKVGLHRELVASGEDRGAPYQIKWADFDSTLVLLEALRSGRVDIAQGGETGVLFALGNGSRISVLAAWQETRSGGSAILVRKDSPVRTVADLRNRKIALPFYSKQHYQLARALEQAGIPFDRNNVLSLNTTDGLSALVNRQVDAFVVWDPNTAIAQTQYDARILVPLKNVIEVPGLVYAPTSALDDPLRRLALEDATRRIIRAKHRVLQDPARWASDIAELSHIPLAAAQLQVSRTYARYEPAGSPQNIESWQKEIAYFYQTGQIRQQYQIADHIAPGFGAIVADENARLGKQA
jgi:sulfonate transport system substrate-binding protein